MHLFVDISGHGYGHLAITAPVLNALAKAHPALRLTLRSALPLAKLRERIEPPFEHLEAASDFGFQMLDANRIDLAASADAYRRLHAEWPARVADEAKLLASLRPDRVLTCVSYLPLAAAGTLGIPSFALCSLNWADLFRHFFAREPWMPPIHAEMLAAYRAADAFLRVTPGMAMPDLDCLRPVGLISRLGRKSELPVQDERAVLVSLGGIPTQLSLAHWPVTPGVRWIVPAAWACERPDVLIQETLGLHFTDLLASVDAVLTKPGYGTFTEAACNGVPVLYVRRDDWPEQECLIEWLAGHATSQEIAPEALLTGDLADALAALWQQAARPRPVPGGIDEAVACLLAGV